ncbi:MAG: cation diffusion facilitator family transporter [Firmicutes bacterium]|nr:cation diffusion facilitator family transporter [Bacillota bacterium]
MGKSQYITKHDKSTKIVLRVTIIGILANLVLVILKSVFGFIFGNLSVLSDAVHSASDLFTSLFIIVAVFISSPKRDKEHNYGHEKVEYLFVLFFAVVIAVVGGLLAWQGVEGIVSPKKSEFNWYLVSVTVASMVIKEGLFWYEIYYAKKTGSEMLKADAWHSRSDSLSSVAVLIGLVCANFIKTNIAESIAVLIVSLMMFKVAYDIAKPALNQLTDRAASDKTIEKIKEVTLSVSGVNSVESLRTRLFGKSIFVDLIIGVNGNLTVNEAYEIAETAHNALEATEELTIKHCVVSVKPSNEI